LESREKGVVFQGKDSEFGVEKGKRRNVQRFGPSSSLDELNFIRNRKFLVATEIGSTFLVVGQSPGSRKKAK
jgi:hypothetical protein